jgi:hypothetical protein
MAQIRWARGPWLAPGSVYAGFPKDKEFRAFEMLEKIEISLFLVTSMLTKRRCTCKCI